MKSKQSVNEVKDLTGRPCELFAYPNGRKQDYDEESMRILERFGIQAAVTTIEGLNDERTSPLELRRYGIGGDLSIENFERMI